MSKFTSEESGMSLRFNSSPEEAPPTPNESYGFSSIKTCADMDSQFNDNFQWENFNRKFEFPINFKIDQKDFEEYSSKTMMAVMLCYRIVYFIGERELYILLFLILGFPVHISNMELVSFTKEELSSEEEFINFPEEASESITTPLQYLQHRFQTTVSLKSITILNGEVEFMVKKNNVFYLLVEMKRSLEVYGGLPKLDGIWQHLSQLRVALLSNLERKVTTVYGCLTNWTGFYFIRMRYTPAAIFNDLSKVKWEHIEISFTRRLQFENSSQQACFESPIVLSYIFSILSSSDETGKLTLGHYLTGLDLAIFDLQSSVNNWLKVLKDTREAAEAKAEREADEALAAALKREAEARAELIRQTKARIEAERNATTLKRKLEEMIAAERLVLRFLQLLLIML